MHIVGLCSWITDDGHGLHYIYRVTAVHLSTMPLSSIQEWRARIGTSWCALGRPIKPCRSKSSCFKNPPSQKKAMSCSRHGAVTVGIMIALLIGAICTFSHFIMAGHCLVDTSKCTAIQALINNIIA